jgi:hypothetical protein
MEHSLGSAVPVKLHYATESVVDVLTHAERLVKFP